MGKNPVIARKCELQNRTKNAEIAESSVFIFVIARRIAESNKQNGENIADSAFIFVILSVAKYLRHCEKSHFGRLRGNPQ
ncbi:hypothetical protein [Helicobacter sp. 23-1045]